METTITRLVGFPFWVAQISGAVLALTAYHACSTKVTEGGSVGIQSLHQGCNKYSPPKEDRI